jgi:AcrR family transcriptional regulator
VAATCPNCGKFRGRGSVPWTIYAGRVPGKPRSDRRERLLDAAFAMFLDKGYEGTAITDIERSVGLKAGTGGFYRHFRSKEELLDAAVAREVARCMEDIARERSRLCLPDDPREQMVVAAGQVLRDLRRFDGLFRLMVAERDRVPELRQVFANALVSSEAVGPWVNESERLVTIAALLGYHFFSYLTSALNAVVPEDDFVHALVAMLPPGRPPGVPPAMTPPGSGASVTAKKEPPARRSPRRAKGTG